ncbi:MAG: hypothetical protein NTY65_04955 [Planctomycetota bacterium]|nr:hypothetical protein [Planctomycetota bacterium]
MTPEGTEVPFGGVHSIVFKPDGTLGISVLEPDKDHEGALFNLDSSKTPKKIDVSLKNGQMLRGIYELLAE